MKFNLKEQIISKEIINLISRQKLDEELDMHQMSRKNLKELKAVLQGIEENTVPKNLVVRKLPGKIGSGVFLHPNAKPMERLEVVAPYAGVVTVMPQFNFDDADYAFDPVTDLRLTKEEQKFFDPKNKYHPKRLYALKLDALKKGNFTRFLNHSSKPNVIAYLVSTKENPYQIIYFAKRKILPGEQLLVSYEDGENNYWGPLGITPFPMTARTFQIDASLKVISRKSKV